MQLKHGQLTILSVLAGAALAGAVCSFSAGNAASAASLPAASVRAESFAGEGTAASPYLIASPADLGALSARVAAGERYRGAFFRQTADLDFSSYGAFCPIGMVGSGTAFEGVYDGDGYVLQHLTIDTSFGSVENALFGALGGTVVNLGVESGTISGAVCATFAAMGEPGTLPVIRNCYSLATLDADARAGGIADNYNGLIENCWAYHEDGYPLVSYSAQMIRDSYSNGEIISGTAETEGCQTLKRRKLLGADCLDALSERALLFAMEAGTRPLGWCKKQGGPALVEASPPWEGKGTRTNPYLLSSAEDFVYLSASVNGGNSYADRYFRMTGDVDCSALETFVPIGLFGTENAFSGTLDGAGYALTGLTVKAAPGHVDNGAVFGTLGGTVVNFGLVGGEIRGGCTAGIAVSGTPESRIVNCFVKETALLGVTRNSGISDNFAGKIAGCFFDGSEPLSAYGATMIAYCVTGGRAVGERGAASFENEEFFAGDCTQSMNDRIVFAALRIAFDPSLVRTWENGRPAGSPRALSGKGGRSDPYRIETPMDLVYFAASVNGGTRYDSRWVLQTADLDMEGVFFLPIGLADTLNRFYGTYDGGGHIIEHLTIHSNELTQKNALFGSLFGSVLNVGLESGTIYGDYAAGIASEGYHLKTKILNSYSKATVYGNVRAGGFVDDFGGDLFNCWYDGAQKLPFCSFRAGLLYHCYANGNLTSYGASIGEISECVEQTDFARFAKEESFDRLFNESSLVGSTEYGFTRSSMVLWEISPEGALQFSGERFALNGETFSLYRDLILKVYFWNLIGILAIFFAVVGVIVSFVTERALRKKHERKNR